MQCLKELYPGIKLFMALMIMIKMYCQHIDKELVIYMTTGTRGMTMGNMDIEHSSHPAVYCSLSAKKHNVASNSC